MAFPGLSSIQIWLASFQQPLQNLIDNPLRKSTIPQFILDAKHPWILANKRKLESLPNAEAFLCSSSNLLEPRKLAGSETEKRTEVQRDGETLEIPPDLFENLEINNYRVGVSPPGWPNALERLSEMKRCPHALTQVKKLEVDIYAYRGTNAGYQKLLEPSRPPRQVLILFGDVLESMTNLETLKWNIPKEDTHFFEKEFTARKLNLPSIKHLEPGPSSHYLVRMCPNLERLRNGGGYLWYHGYMPDNRDWGLMLIQSTVWTPKLKRFEMVGGHQGWTVPLVSEVVKSIPQIESLGLLGSLGSDMGYTGIDTGDIGILKRILDELTQLKNLKCLNLPQSSGLGLGFDGGSGCGNAYFGKQGRIHEREVVRRGAKATARGGDIVIASLPHLVCFTIGGTRANITRSEDGGVNVTWPWTGRMGEWLMEVVPERSDFEDEEYGSM